MSFVALDRQTALWALANERRHWSPDEIGAFRNDSSLLARAAVGKARQATLSPLPRRHDPVEAALGALLTMEASGVAVLRLDESGYPPRLASIPNPPLVLYVIGSLYDFSRCVAVSGTRTPSEWGAETARALGRASAERGFVVASGLAEGVDTQAHLGALSVPGGLTVAVSALALTRVYPSQNLQLAQQIADRGAVVSEHGLNESSRPCEFVRRNRIISGISSALFVVESSGKGGTLHQARFALDQKRPVFVMRPPAGEEGAERGFEALVGMGARPCGSVEEAATHFS